MGIGDTKKMDINELHIKLIKKQVDNFYIFTGIEIAVQNIYINRIVECAGLKLTRLDTVKDVVNEFRGVSLLSQQKCYVVRDDVDFAKTESAWKSVVNLLGGNILILTYTKLDKRSAFYKRHKDIICEFAPLSTELLQKYIEKQITLSKKNSKELIECCDNDYSRILLECDKIKRLSDELSITADEAFDKLIDEGVIFTTPRDLIFMWIDAVLSHKCESAWHFYHETRRFGTTALPMIAVLYNSAKQLLQVQSCESSNIEKATGLSSFQIKQMKRYIDVYSNRQLLKLMKLLHTAEVGIKTGKIDEQLALDYVMINFEFNVEMV